MPVIGNIGWTDEQRERFYRVFNKVHPKNTDPPPNIIYEVLCPAIQAEWTPEDEKLRRENITRPP